MTFAMVAGEASGDLLGGALLAACRQRWPQLQAVGIGGPAMQAQGFEAWWPQQKLAVRGYVEVLPHLLRPRVRALMRRVQDAVALVLAGYLCWQGYKGVMRTLDNESVTLPVPDAVLYLALPVGTALWGLALWRRLRRPQAAPGAAQP